MLDAADGLGAAMTDLEFRQHQVERWREINWLAMWNLIGVFYAMEIC